MGEFLLFLSFFFYLLSSISFWIYLFNRKERLKKIGFSIFGIGYLMQIFYIGYMDIKLKTFSINSFNDIPNFIAFIIGSIFYILVLIYREKIKDISPLVATMNTMFIAFSLPLIQTEKIAKFNNLWFSVHIISSAVSLSLILFSTLTAIIYLFLQKDLKEKRFNSFLVSKMNISLDTIYKIIYKLNTAILISLFVMLISSLMWQNKIKNIKDILSIENLSVSFLILYYGIIIHIQLFKPEKRNLQVLFSLFGGILSALIFILWLLGHKN